MTSRTLYAVRVATGVTGLCTSPLWFPHVLEAAARLLGAV